MMQTEKDYAACFLIVILRAAGSAVAPHRMLRDVKRSCCALAVCLLYKIGSAVIPFHILRYQTDVAAPMPISLLSGVDYPDSESGSAITEVGVLSIGRARSTAVFCYAPWAWSGAL